MSADIGGTYYPACIVNLLIRFDEAFNADARIEARVIDLQSPSKIGPTGAEINASLSNFDLSTPSEISNPTTSGSGKLPVGAQLFDANANQKGSSILGRIPLRASVELNNIRKPGTFNLTFDYKDLPIDPRLVRAVGVEIFMDTVAAEDFAAGIAAGSTAQVAPSTKKLNGFVPFKATPGNLVLKGIVDEWSVSHGTSGSTATISGRDMTGVLMNTPVTPKMLQVMATQMNNTIDKVVRGLISSVGTWAGYIEVDVAKPEEWPNKQIPYVANIGKLDPLLFLDEEDASNTGKKPRSRISVQNGLPRISAGAHQDKLNVWDLITRYCNVVAAVPYFTIEHDAASNSYKSVLIIRPQWGLYDYYSANPNLDSFPQSSAPSPFKNGKVRNVDGNYFKVRKLSYGRNIEELTLERKYQGITARAVEVVSYNSSSTAKGPDRLLSAISGLKKSYLEKAGVASQIAPLDSSPVAGEVPSGLSKQDEVLRVEVRGITDIKQLQTLADGLYEEIMRGETGGSVRTRTLASFGGNNEDPDLLRIRPRDPLELSVDIRTGGSLPTGTTNTVIGQAAKEVSALEKEIFERTKDRNLARAVAYSSRNAVAQLQNAFRVNSVSFDWDVNSGISISIDFHNYIVARDSVLDTSLPAPAGAPKDRATAVNATRKGGT